MTKGVWESFICVAVQSVIINLAAKRGASW